MVLSHILGNLETLEGVTGTTTSTAVDLTFCNVVSVQATIDVDTPSAKTFDSGVAASLVVEDITYTADLRGTAGNSITVEYIDTGVPGEALSVAVVSSGRIQVTLELAEDVAELEEQDLTYTAVEAGSVGNAITITYVADGTAGAETVDVTGTDVVVHMDDTAVIGSTATNILDAVEASVPASALVTVAVTGTGSNVQAASAETPLAGGSEDPVSTATEVAAAVQGNAPAATLVAAIVTGTGSDVQTAEAETALAGGEASEVDADANTLTIPVHGLPTGLKGQLTTTGTLPTGLSLSTDYFVIVVDENTIKLAISLANALLGTAINITSQGASGSVNTFTPTALAGATIKLQKSNDGLTYVDEGSATNITVDATLVLEKVDPACQYMRVSTTATAGSMSMDLKWFGKGFNN